MGKELVNSHQAKEQENLSILPMLFVLLASSSYCSSGIKHFTLTDHRWHSSNTALESAHSITFSCTNQKRYKQHLDRAVCIFSLCKEIGTVWQTLILCLICCKVKTASLVQGKEMEGLRMRVFSG